MVSDVALGAHDDEHVVLVSQMQALRQECNCPITHQPMRDPVVAADTLFWGQEELAWGSRPPLSFVQYSTVCLARGDDIADARWVF